MFYSIPRTKMLSSAQDSLSPASKPRNMAVEILIFLLITLIVSVPQTIVISIATVVSIFSDPEFVELMSQAVNGIEIDTAMIEEFANSFAADMPPVIFIVTLAASGLMIPAGIIYCRCIEKRPLFSMGFNKRGFVTEYLMGIAAGALMISIPVLVCHLTGAATLSFNANADPIILAGFFFAFVLQGMGEEVLFRGYFLTTLSRRHRIWTAIIVSSLMFAVMHIGNANFNIIAFLNITLFGIFAAVYMLKRGSIWGISAIHTVWNFMQGNIFGFSVSGTSKLPAVLDCKLAEVGEILSGGEFGIEGGLGATIVLLVALVVILAMPAKKQELADVHTEQ